MATGATPKTLTLPYTGKEFLASLDDGREVWIYGERVKNITAHPAFQNCARMLARLYDALHEDHTRGAGILTMPTDWGGFTHRYFRAPTTLPEQGRNFAVVFMVPTNAKGVKLICRVSNEMRAALLGSPFDYPLSSRLDENDAIFVMDDVFVPWEDVFVYADVEKANNFFPRTGFLPRALIHGCTRLAVKLDFITGLMIKATEITGARAFRGVEANIGEVIAWRNMIWGLSDAMAKTADPWTSGCILPGMEPAAAYQVLAPEACVQVKNLIEKTVASGLIYLNSHARDFKTPDLRKYLDLYLRGSGGVDAVGRVKLMKLLWDALGSEFGGRHELYEINYSGSHEEIRRYALFGALASGQYERWKQFAETCMAEYDLDGWTTKDLVNTDGMSARR